MPSKIGAMIALAVVACVLAGCSKSRHGADEKYYLVSTNIKLPYWQAAGAGFSRASTKLGVPAEFVGPDTYDAKGEVDAFRKLLTRKDKPTGILVSPADPELMKPAIDEAVAAGIPVITIDSDAPSSKRLFFIGTNNYQAGLLGGDVASKKLHGKGNVVVFTMPGQVNLDERLHGYKDAFAKTPQIRITQVIDIRGDSRIAFDTTDRMTGKKEPVDAFVCLEASACKEVAEVLDRQHIKDKVVVAMDTDDDTLNWIKKGAIAATIAQRPGTMAYMGMKMLDDLYHNKLDSLDADFGKDPLSPVPVFVDTGATLIDQSNVDSFLSKR